MSCENEKCYPFAIACFGILDRLLRYFSRYNTIKMSEEALMRSIHTILPLGVALACLIGACSTGSGSAGAPGFADAPPDGEPIVLNVYAAASLTRG